MAKASQSPSRTAVDFGLSGLSAIAITLIQSDSYPLVFESWAYPSSVDTRASSSSGSGGPAPGGHHGRLPRSFVDSMISLKSPGVASQAHVYGRHCCERSNARAEGAIATPDRQ